MKESKIIQSLFKKTTPPSDDCFYRDGYLYTTDSLAEGTHFLHNWSSPEDLAIKLLHVNLSDIVACGGEPEFCLLTLGLSPLSAADDWLTEFSDKFQFLLEIEGITLVGGDTYSSPITNLGLTMVGKTSNPITREGAFRGDSLYTTGSLGYSKLGMNILNSSISKKNIPDDIIKISLDKHLRPKSRRKEFKKIYEKYTVHSAMDSTDGLFQDLNKLGTASHMGIDIFLESLPDYEILREFLSPEEIITAGEELEILFFSPSEIPGNLATKIGFVNGGNDNKFYERNREIKVTNPGFLHFGES